MEINIRNLLLKNFLLNNIIMDNYNVSYKEGDGVIIQQSADFKDITGNAIEALNKEILQNDANAVYDNNCDSCHGGAIKYIINPLNNKKYLLNSNKSKKIIKNYIDFSLNRNKNQLFSKLNINGYKYKTVSLNGLKKIKELMQNNYNF